MPPKSSQRMSLYICELSFMCLKKWRKHLQIKIIFEKKPRLKIIVTINIHESFLFQVMQFGRIDHNAYTLDFQYPFSAVQAFAVALANVTQRLKWTFKFSRVFFDRKKTSSRQRHLWKEWRIKKTGLELWVLSIFENFQEKTNTKVIIILNTRCFIVYVVSKSSKADLNWNVNQKKMLTLIITSQLSYFFF